MASLPPALPPADSGLGIPIPSPASIFTNIGKKIIGSYFDPARKNEQQKQQSIKDFAQEKSAVEVSLIVNSRNTRIKEMFPSVYEEFKPLIDQGRIEPEVIQRMNELLPPEQQIKNVEDYGFWSELNKLLGVETYEQMADVLGQPVPDIVKPENDPFAVVWDAGSNKYQIVLQNGASWDGNALVRPNNTVEEALAGDPGADGLPHGGGGVGETLPQPGTVARPGSPSHAKPPSLFDEVMSGLGEAFGGIKNTLPIPGSEGGIQIPIPLPLPSPSPAPGDDSTVDTPQITIPISFGNNSSPSQAAAAPAAVNNNLIMEKVQDPYALGIGDGGYQTLIKALLSANQSKTIGDIF